MSVRRLLSIVSIGSALALAAPALPAGAAPSGGCPSPSSSPVLSLTVAPTTIKAAHTISASGRFHQNNGSSCGIKDASVKLQRRALVNGKPSGSWTTWKTVTTGSLGYFSAKRMVLNNEQERAIFFKAGSFPTTVSKVFTENVRIWITKAVTTPAGCKIRLTGKTTPVQAKRRVFIQSRGPQGKFQGWFTIGQTTTHSDGTYSTSAVAKCGQTYNLSVFMYPSSVNTSGRSATTFGIKPHN
jgi:hypothetical protein